MVFLNRILFASSKSIGGKCSHVGKMAVHIKRSVKWEGMSEEMNNSIHYMPCQIHTDGQANVSKYFTPSIKSQDGNDGMYKEPG
jgi:Ribonuclease H2 non-catalytic subunit (Ylr154p-like).